MTNIRALFTYSIRDEGLSLAEECLLLIGTHVEVLVQQFCLLR